jgi:hypothetical protein
VHPAQVIEDLDELEDGPTSCLSGGHVEAVDEFLLEVAKKLSATALSQHWRGRESGAEMARRRSGLVQAA